MKVIQSSKRGPDSHRGKKHSNPPRIPRGIKPFHARPPGLRHPLADEFAQFAWSADFGLTTPSVVAKPLYILYDRRNVTSTTRVPKWEQRGKCHYGKPWQWMAETEISSSFNKPQLDARWNLYNPHLPQVQRNSSQNRSQPLPVKTRFDCFQ